jgi:hypothetical protein
MGYISMSIRRYPCIRLYPTPDMSVLGRIRATEISSGSTLGGGWEHVGRRQGALQISILRQKRTISHG